LISNKLDFNLKFKWGLRIILKFVRTFIGEKLLFNFGQNTSKR